MNRLLARSATTAGLIFLIPLSGCLERKEAIRVDRNGGVAMRVEIKGDAADFGAGDALPDRRFGWDCKDEIETEPDGKQVTKRTALREFAAGEPLPDSFVDEHDPQYGIALTFPTTVTVEKRRDGTYYHFKRVYQARSEARYAIYKELLKPQHDQLQQFAGKDPADLTDDERGLLVGILRTTEALKRGEYVAVAAEALDDEWPQDYGLRLRTALIEHFEKLDSSRLIEMLGQPASPERDDAINEFGQAMIQGGRDALRAELQKLRVTRDQMEKFFAAHDTEEARRAVTEDIGDERWEVRVELPGEIVAHNATSIDGRAAVWQFPGKALYDREHVLMATSRLAPGGRGD